MNVLLTLLVTLLVPRVEPPVPGGAIEAVLEGRVVALPLLRTEMKTTVRGDLATVALTQRFENPHAAPMHARYIFPLPPEAAVFAMRMVIGEQVIEAEIRPVEEARATFEAAKQAGKQAALLTQHRPNVFTQEIAHLMPKAPIEVTIRYAHAVPKRDGAYRFHFPMVVGPRYLPAPAETDGPPLKALEWSLRATPPVAPPSAVDPARVSIEVDLDAGLAVEWIDSPSHAIDVRTDGPTRRVVRLAENRTVDDQDFELRYRLSGAQGAVGVTAARDGDEGVVGLLIEPPAGALDSLITPREMVFVLDCSGSMSGEPLAAARRLVRRALARLRPTDTFRVIQFSHAASEFAARPLPATRENVQRGLAYLDSLYGSGGTEMMTGVEAAFAPAADPAALRVVVFLTDGYIGNDVEIVRLVQSRRGEARLFSFGVGNSVNRYLLQEMARVGRGVARIVRPDEDLEQAADDLADRLVAPFLTDVRVDWGDAPVRDATPAVLPDLFLGSALRVLAHFEGGGTHRVFVHARMAGRPVRLPVDVDLDRAEATAEALPILWARGQAEDRMQDYLHPLASPERRAALEKEITALGLRHRLVTQWTAFVAVARTPVNAGGAASAADVAVPPVAGVSPNAYPAGSGFVGKAAPEPAQWAAMLLLLALAAWRLRSRAA